MRLKSETDTLIAVGVFTVAALISVFSFFDVREIEQESLLIADSVETGDNHYSIQKNNLCIGTFHSKIVKDSNLSLSGSGTVNLSLGGAKFFGELSLTAKFNRLGRLSSFETNLNAPGLDLNISSENVDPINSKLTLRINNKLYNHQQEIKGPVLIKQIPNNQYQIVYPSIPILYKRFLTTLGGSLLRGIKLANTLSFGLNQRCEQDNSSFVQLDAAIHLITNSLPGKDLTDNS